jgi:hypothetical protein
VLAARGRDRISATACSCAGLNCSGVAMVNIYAESN